MGPRARRGARLAWPSPGRWPERAWIEGWLVPGLGLAVPAVLAAVVSLDPRSSWAQTLGDLAILSAALLATVACFRAGRRGDHADRAWRFMALATGVWAMGMAAWTWFGLTRDHQYPFPSIADAGFVGYALPAAAALVLFPRNGDPLVSRVRVLLDGLVISFSLLFVSWGTVLGPLQATGGSGLTRLVTFAYPVADVTMASLVLAMGVRVGGGARRPWILMGGGWLTLAATDSTYLIFLMRGETGLTGSPLVAGWVLPFVLIALATRTRVVVPSVAGSHTFTVTQEMLPYVPVVGAVLVGSHRDVLSGEDGFLLSMGAVLVALLALQQAAIAFEKVTLANQLDRLVAERTAQLADAVGRTELVLNSAGDGICGVDTEGRITFANPAAAQILGSDVGELVGRSIHVLLEERTEDVPAPPTRVVKGVASGVGTLRRHDGTVVELEQVVSPILRDGAVTGSVITFRDITERRAVERMKDEFVSVVSHELRTPLTAIRGSLGLLAGGVLGRMPQQAEPVLTIAVENSERLTRLITDILDLERMESGTMPMDFGVHEARELLTTTLATLRPLAEAAGVLLLDGGASGTVRADEDRIAQALTNLVGNAIKFSTPGNRILVSAAREGETVVFHVEDEGRGVPADKLDSIFDRFHQVDGSDTRVKGGTGLGLAITKTIVERHGGTIRVDSAEGRGSVFSFTVPAASDAAEAKAGDDRELTPSAQDLPLNHRR
jgi:two-component system sensor histidine kinase/response regulator